MVGFVMVAATLYGTVMTTSIGVILLLLVVYGFARGLYAAPFDKCGSEGGSQRDAVDGRLLFSVGLWHRDDAGADFVGLFGRSVGDACELLCDGDAYACRDLLDRFAQESLREIVQTTKNPPMQLDFKTMDFPLRWFYNSKVMVLI